MDNKVYEPEVIVENPFPSQPDLGFVPGQSNPTGVYTPTSTREKVFPRKRTAVELLSSALNTRSRKILQQFALQQSGGFQIGNFEEGISGDLRITPNGLTARDIAGLTTISIDGTSGDVAIKGELRSGSVITGEVIVGNNRMVLTVDDDGQPQILLNDGTNDRMIIGFQSGGF